MQRSILVGLALLCGIAAAGCGGTGGGPNIAPGPDMSTLATDGPAPAPDMASGQCVMHQVPCTDNQVQDLSLFKKASTRKIENTADGPGGWISRVDASGGGFTPNESFVYARFTDNGLERVNVGDEAAFQSGEWDIAFRRYLIRLDSGVAGPSCVTAAAVAGAYDDLRAVPGNLDLAAESYYDDKCALVPDKSGLGGPSTRLNGFWRYSMCVQMTGQLYVIRLPDGRHVKLTVTSYYAPDVQKTCDETGSTPMGAAGGDLRVRWALLGN